MDAVPDPFFTAGWKQLDEFRSDKSIPVRNQRLSGLSLEHYTSYFITLYIDSSICTQQLYELESLPNILEDNKSVWILTKNWVEIPLGTLMIM